jgi:amino acid transporter
MLINVTQALGELSILYPVSGGYYTLAIRFLDQSWGFAMGWNYFLQWAIVLPLEILVAGTTVQYWDGAKGVHIAGWITIFWFSIILINIFGTLGFAEEEFWSSCLKLTVVVMFIIAGIGSYSPSPFAFVNVVQYSTSAVGPITASTTSALAAVIGTSASIDRNRSLLLLINLPVLDLSPTDSRVFAPFL